MDPRSRQVQLIVQERIRFNQSTGQIQNKQLSLQRSSQSQNRVHTQLSTNDRQPNQNSRLISPQKTSEFGSRASEPRIRLSFKEKEQAVKELNSLPNHIKFQSTQTVLKYLEEDYKFQPTFIKNRQIFSKKHIMNKGVKNVTILSPIAKNPKSHDYFEQSPQRPTTQKQASNSVSDATQQQNIRMSKPIQEDSASTQVKLVDLEKILDNQALHIKHLKMDIMNVFAPSKVEFEQFEKNGGVKIFEILSGCEKYYQIALQDIMAPLELHFNYQKKKFQKRDCLVQINCKTNFEDPMNLEQVFKNPKHISYYGSKRLFNNKFRQKMVFIRIISGIGNVSCEIKASFPKQELFEQQCLEGTAVFVPDDDDPAQYRNPTLRLKKYLKNLVEAPKSKLDEFFQQSDQIKNDWAKKAGRTKDLLSKNKNDIQDWAQSSQVMKKLKEQSSKLLREKALEKSQEIETTRHKEKLFLYKKWSIIKERKSDMLEVLTNLQVSQSRQTVFIIFLTINKIMKAAQKTFEIKREKAAYQLKLMFAALCVLIKFRAKIKRQGEFFFERLRRSLKSCVSLTQMLSHETLQDRAKDKLHMFITAFKCKNIMLKQFYSFQAELVKIQKFAARKIVKERVQIALISDLWDKLLEKMVNKQLLEQVKAKKQTVAENRPVKLQEITKQQKLETINLYVQMRKRRNLLRGYEGSNCNEKLKKKVLKEFSAEITKSCDILGLQSTKFTKKNLPPHGRLLHPNDADFQKLIDFALSLAQAKADRKREAEKEAKRFDVKKKKTENKKSKNSHSEILSHSNNLLTPEEPPLQKPMELENGLLNSVSASTFTNN